MAIFVLLNVDLLKVHMVLSTAYTTLGIPEDKVDMCKAIEMRINSERKNERENTLLQNIKMMMKNAHFTLEQAFATLEVPISDQPRLAGLL